MPPSALADGFPAVVSLGRPAIGVCLLAERRVIKDGFSIRTGERRRNAGVNVYQAIDAGQGQHPLHGRRPDDQAHFSAIGLGPPERAH